MPLHDRDAIRHRLEEVVFAHSTLSQEVPKYRFPLEQMSARSAYQVVSDELALPGGEGRGV